ncbi:hypothetical protein OAU72_05230 [Hyphomicrobiales bacterium]|jgi:hypothetical protein|nr:hypothetical protein [Hyphomicrobiales bacterium]
MKKILFIITLILPFLISSESWGSSLPECKGSPSDKSNMLVTFIWDNCQGIVILENNAKYVGEYKDGIFHGHGTYTFPNGEEYIGEYKAGSRHGQGTYTYLSGQTYKGAWKEGISHGQGSDTWPDGSKYVGEFKNDLYHGQGTYIYAGVYKYVGEWKDGLFNGQGTYTWENGEIYSGEFKDGLFNGQGTYAYAGGQKYVGEWKDGEYNGQGTFTTSEGNKLEGIFKENEFLYKNIVTSKDDEHSEEVGHYDNGNLIYKENFTNGELKSESTMTICSDGLSQEIYLRIYDEMGLDVNLDRYEITQVNSNICHFKLYLSTHRRNYIYKIKEDELVNLPDGDVLFGDPNDNKVIIKSQKSYLNNLGGAIWYNSERDMDGKLLTLLDTEGGTWISKDQFYDELQAQLTAQGKDGLIVFQK